MSSITFPAISAMVSRNTDPDQQGECLGTHLMGGGSTQQVLGWAGTSVPAVECLCTHSSIDTHFEHGWCFTRELPGHASGCLVVSV